MEHCLVILIIFLSSIMCAVACIITLITLNNYPFLHTGVAFSKHIVQIYSYHGGEDLRNHLEVCLVYLQILLF